MRVLVTLGPPRALLRPLVAWRGVGDLVTTRRSSLTLCAECKRTMRPRNTTIVEYPNTVAKGGWGRCGACRVRQKRSGVEFPKPAMKRTQGVCERCPQSRELRDGLCPDCRDVLSPEEQGMWAA